MMIATDLAGCVLRPWKPEDKPSLLRNANHRNVWQNMTDMFPHPYTDADADRWLSLAFDDGAAIHFAIEFHGEAVGGIGIVAGEGCGRYTGQLGYWLGESVWGNGIATAAVRAMVADARVRSRFVRLEAPVFPWNVASMRVLEKSGFTREGVLRMSAYKDERIVDRVLYALVRAREPVETSQTCRG